jgi:hypothetical protein
MKHIVFLIIIILVILFINNTDKIEQLFTRVRQLFSPENELKFGINLSKENGSMFIIKNLKEHLDQFNGNQIVLDGNLKKNKFIYATTDKFLQDELRQISKIILSEINNDIFTFQYVNTGDVVILTDEEGNRNYKYDLFVTEKTQFTQFKFYINVIKFIDNQNYVKYEDTLDQRQVFKYYPIGIPSKEQLIPDAMDVIPTGNDVLSTASINVPQLPEIKRVYINSIGIENANWLLNNYTDNNRENKLCGGISDNSYDFSMVHGDTEPYIEHAKIRNRWPTLEQEPCNYKNWPVIPKNDFWNMFGIYNRNKAITSNEKAQYGETWATTCVPARPGNENPTVTQLPRGCGQYAELFNMTNGSGASSSGMSQPPP